tara:strand:+ start:2773 stop:3210 length:438 start_codon:yes stop_codon:yes gene_type:complete
MQLDTIPYFLYFILLLFLVAKFSKKIEKRKDQSNETFLEPLSIDKSINPFLLDAETKLIALKELFFQELISEKIYIEKTNRIADIVSKVIKNDIFEFAQKKNAEIVKEVKNDIFNKFENNNKSNVLEPNIDDLLVSIDKRLEKKQ